jgi:hypothetical protein
MTTLRMTEATTLYTAGNNAGKGYEPGGATVDDAVTAMVADGGELILDRSTSDDVAVVIDSAGELVAIGGDATGGNAWAVTIVDAAEIEALKTAAGQAGDLAQVAYATARWPLTVTRSSLAPACSPTALRRRWIADPTSRSASSGGAARGAGSARQ